MSMAAVKDELLYLGIDGGGSKCRSSLVSASGEVLGVGLSGPANPLHGMSRALNSIDDAARQALSDAGLKQGDMQRVVAGVALAGVNLPSLFAAVNDWRHPFAQMHLMTDLHAACLGAHHGEDGAVMVIGTGSCGFASVEGRSCLLGGHGFLLGDKGSGAWLGLRGIKAVLLAEDGLAPATRLSEAVMETYGVSGLDIVQKLSHSASSDFGRLASLVLQAADRGDAAALEIVREGAAYLDALARKLLLEKPPRFSVIGGLSGLMQQWMSAEIVARIEPPLGQPEIGAIHYAREQSLVTVE
ncbi:ATPase [Pseudomaricurvus alkylphenolicus]|nr:ATPase [Pseudomaricurvus alkylphenolicus]